MTGTDDSDAASPVQRPLVYLKRKRRERRKRRSHQKLFNRWGKLSRKIQRTHSKERLERLFRRAYEVLEEMWDTRDPDDKRATANRLWKLQGVRLVNPDVTHERFPGCSDLIETAPSFGALNEFMEHYCAHINAYPRDVPPLDGLALIGENAFNGTLNVENITTAIRLSATHACHLSKILARSDVELFLNTASDVMDAIGDESRAKSRFAEGLSELSLDELRKTLRMARYVRSRYAVEPDPPGDRTHALLRARTVMDSFCLNVLEATRARVVYRSRGVIMFFALGHATVAQTLEEMRGVCADDNVVARISEACREARVDEDAFLEWIEENGDELRKLINDDGEPIVELWAALMPEVPRA